MFQVVTVVCSSQWGSRVTYGSSEVNIWSSGSMST
jgi:hypothetical protein